jgi:hypothetical protein
MSDYDFRFRELERRMGLVEEATRQVPVIARDLHEIRSDVTEARADIKAVRVESKEDSASIRKALYTASVSVLTGAIGLMYAATEFFR